MRPFIVTFLLNFVSSRRIALMILIRTDQDDSSSNELLAQLLCQIKITEKYFESVAQKIFKDGIDWRRIISFLYMSYKLILKAVDEKGSIDLIMSWLKRYFCQYLVGWISSNGGWVRNVFSCSTHVIIVIITLFKLAKSKKKKKNIKNYNRFITKLQ